MKFQLFLMVALVVLAAPFLCGVDAARVGACNQVCERGADHVRECCRAHGYGGGYCSYGSAICG